MTTRRAHRSPGAGTVRKLPSGRWQARATGPNGRQVAIGTFATKTEAERALTQSRAAADRGSWQDPRSGKVTLEVYAEAWLASRRYKPRTLETYERSLRVHILPVLGRHPLEKINAATVRAWHAGILKPTPARQSYALLHAIMTTAVEDEVLPSNPCRIKGAGTPRTTERPYVEPEQVADLVGAMPDHLQALCVVAYAGHLRLGEVLALRWLDLDLQAGTLRVRRAVSDIGGEQVEDTPKWESSRPVVLSGPAVDLLRRHRAAHPGLPSARVFTRPDGGPLRHGHVQWAWRQARERVGLHEVTFHDIRHAGLTLATIEGGSQREVQHRGGHRTARAAAGYQHIAAGRDATLAERMAGAVAQVASGTR